MALSGHPDTTTQKCSRAENISLCKTCRVISVIATVCVCVCVCVCVSVSVHLNERERYQVHILSPAIKVCCQLYIWPRSTLQGTGVITQHFVQYIYKCTSPATRTYRCIHYGHTAVANSYMSYYWTKHTGSIVLITARLFLLCTSLYLLCYSKLSVSI